MGAYSLLNAASERRRSSALRTDGSIHGLPVESRYAPTHTLTLRVSVQVLKASAIPRMASGGPWGMVLR